jgi:predicted acylesterase/phospholipase RssA
LRTQKQCSRIASRGWSVVKLAIKALALSGGGFRATLFHLGVIQYLRDADLLANVQVISSVSGGSIVAAHLVQNWDRYTGTQADFETASDELLRFTRYDVRGRIVRRLMFAWAANPVLHAVFRSRNKAQPAATWLLQRYYDRLLFHGATLHELRATPQLHILATNLTRGCLTSFGQRQIAHYTTGNKAGPTIVHAGLTSVAAAVSASSAYPALFPPLSMNHEDVGAREDRFEKQFFTDAGVTDNLGIHALDWNELKPDELVLVSDAGRSFVVQHATEFGVLRTALRATDLMMFHIRELALARIRSAPAANALLVSISDCGEIDGAAPLAIQQPLETVRTDLDTFSGQEAQELVRHGYFTAERTVGIAGVDRPVFQLDGKSAVYRARQLVSGSRRRLRIVNFKDWLTWAQCAFLLVLAYAAWLVAPKAIDTARTEYAKYKALQLVRRSLPQWTAQTTPEPIIVERLQPTNNLGFKVLREDRVWDLRKLARDPSTRDVRGPALMTRSTSIIRQSPNANEYVYWFETSGRTFSSWPVNRIRMQLRTQKEKILSGNAYVVPWELRMDVSGEKLHEPFILNIQALPVDAFVRKPNWWIAMKVVDPMEAASMRIVFPSGLRYRNPAFTNYPSNTPSQAETFAGHTFVLADEDPQQLIWTVENPRIGWTYRVEWDW